ncbi:MAG: hypothetical protein H9802_15830 [Candidatus Phocaeicola faecipullorum]|nr:hypothetical protein [Candidatus Phocaeicola faecipullorum]
MKHIFLFLFISISISANCQNFRYKHLNNRVWVYPIEKLYSFENKKEVYSSITKDYTNFLFYDIFKKNLSKKSIELLKKKENISTFKFYVDYQGKIIPVNFMLSKEIYDNISEETIKNIYNECLNLQMDISKCSFSKSFSPNNFTIINIVINKLFR